ncbi:hypothetical protein G5C60_14840 [Streptomyces sp. HC44]|uniref:Secreted protein n=1 Tax=Streptomyces scabichelini TaxID=2711217 RepID=A0A6G4V4P9_9ACTN|nr:DUF6344 domain-containing protein [Streptomyces scabichelini]NGO08847.1 hypothetical protein [Streptomyces scabichelini]
MARNKVMKLWTAVITAFIALCTTLGLVTTARAAAVPQTEPARNTKASPTATVPAMSPWAWSFSRTLPPTMKQRIRAEAHGSSPGCRHSPTADVDTPSAAEEKAADSAAPCTT